MKALWAGCIKCPHLEAEFVLHPKGEPQLQGELPRGGMFFAFVLVSPSKPPSGRAAQSPPYPEGGIRPCVAPDANRLHYTTREILSMRVQLGSTHNSRAHLQ